MKGAANQMSPFGSRKASVASLGTTMFVNKQRKKSVSVKETITVMDPLTGEKRSPPAPLSNLKDNFKPSVLKNPGKLSSVPTSGQLSPSTFSDRSEKSDRASVTSGKVTSNSFSESETSSVISDDEFKFFGVSDEVVSVDGQSEGSVKQQQSQQPVKVEEKKKQDAQRISLTPEQTEQLLEEEFIINLTETPTITLFELVDRSVGTDSHEIEEVKARNARYRALKKKKTEYPDLYVENFSQTLNKFKKNKYADIDGVEKVDQEISVTAYEMYDEFELLRIEEEKAKEEKEQISQLTQNKEDEDDNDDDAELEELEDEEQDDVSQSSRSVKSSASDRKRKELFASESLRNSLSIVERMIVQNYFSDKQKMFRSFGKDEEIKNEIDESIADGMEEPKEIALQEVQDVEETGCFNLLWEYSCPIVAGMSVNSISWNKVNSNIVAAAYGNVGFQGSKEGAILCWTISNPTYPDRIYKVNAVTVTALDFCESHPSLLAAGFSDGSISIYDVRSRDNNPIYQGQKIHTGTVWDVQWVDRGKDIGERLHTVGVDGRVISWEMKKGLEGHEMMKLKRSSRKEHEDAIISRETGGLCIDADPADKNLYYVGAEDGTIYKCSCAYNEQYLETYYGHNGPVNRIQCCPLDPSSFISCSADWTIKVWTQEKESASITIEPFTNQGQSKSAAITDVMWSPYSANMFCSTSVTGQVHLWDLSFSTIKPKYLYYKPDTVFTKVSFAPQSPSILVGTKHGTIDVIKTNKVE